MIINPDCLKRIGGDNFEFLVYGLEKCLYFEIYHAIQSPFKGYFYNNIADINLPDPQSNIKRECKNTLTNLVFENYKRVKENKPIIILLFCIQYEDENSSIKLNIKSVAQSHATSTTFVTDSELRRFYKMCNEMDPEIRSVAEKTIKFIKVKLEKDGVYSLEEIKKPIWQTDEFRKLWQERCLARDLRAKKQDDWRKILMDNVQQYNNHLFFQPSTADQEQLSSKLPNNNFNVKCL